MIPERAELLKNQTCMVTLCMADHLTTNDGLTANLYHLGSIFFMESLVQSFLYPTS